VLIVEDNRDMSETLRQLVALAAPDAEIAVVPDAESALARLRKRAPTIMLLDLKLPRMSGLELCLYLQGAKLAQGCHIIPVSGTAREQDIRLLRQLGIRQFIAKSAALPEALIGTIEEFRRRARASS
jgi:DNA-binding response OmpR family regulator